MKIQLLCVAVLGAALAACSGTKSSNANHSSALEGCPSGPPAGAFDNAVCICQDFHDVGSGIVTHGSNGKQANVGVNGYSTTVGDIQVDGDWVAYLGIGGVGSADVTKNLVTIGDAQSVGAFNVGGDLSVGGNLYAVGGVDVGGTLRVQGIEGVVGTSHVANRGAYTAPAGPPCGCDPSQILDIAGLVAAAKTSNNNANLPAINNVGQTAVTLTTGSYYITGIQSVGSAKITIDGAVALYLDGDLQGVGDHSIELTAGSTLDFYISGNLQSVGKLDLGAAGAEGSVRFYVGGTNPVMLAVGSEKLHGLIYAPTADIQLVGDTEVNGALFAKSLQGVGRLTVNYSSAAAPGPGVCDPGDGGTPGGNSDGGQTGDGNPDGGSVCGVLASACSANSPCCDGLTCADNVTAAACTGSNPCTCVANPM